MLMQACLPWDGCFACGFCGFVCVDKCECPRGARMLMQGCLPWDGCFALGWLLGLALGLCFGSVGFGLGGLALAWVGLLWLALGLALAWPWLAWAWGCVWGGLACSWGCVGLLLGLCGVLGAWGVGSWGVGCGSGSSPLGVKGRKGRAGLFFALIVVLVGGLRFFLVRLVGWSGLAPSPFSRALRGWGAGGFHRCLGKAFGFFIVLLIIIVVCKKKALPCPLRPRLSFLRFALPSSWSGLGVCDFSWLVWLVGRGLPPALFPVPCGAGGLGAFIVVSARLLGFSS